MRCAWTWPSSAGGVSHTISIGMPCFCDSSFAAASAPVRADRNTGLVELLAIIAIFSPALSVGASTTPGLPPSLLQPMASARARVNPYVQVLIVVFSSVDSQFNSPSAFLGCGRGPTPARPWGPTPWLPALALLAPVISNNKSLG